MSLAVCGVGFGGCQSGSEGFVWFSWVFNLECGGSDCNNGVFVVGFLYVSCFVRRFSSVSVVVAV